MACPVIFFSQPKRSYVSFTSTGLKQFLFVTKFRRLHFNKFAVLSGVPSMPKNLSITGIGHVTRCASRAPVVGGCRCVLLMCAGQC